VPRSQGLAEAGTVTSSGARQLVQLITPGWGSSGYYGAPVLAEAASNRVFPAGTHMYIDHPTAQEAADRPERSVRDLAAVLTEDAHVDPTTGGLVAPVQVFGTWQTVLAEMKDDIGVSIRATGTGQVGEAEGRRGLIISSLDEGLSVDFVTAAGRGGRILEILESAPPTHPQVVELVEAAGITASDLGRALSAALDDTYRADGVYAWARDNTDEWVVFDIGGDKAPQAGTFQQTFVLNDDGTVTLTGIPVEVVVRTTYAPVGDPLPALTTTQESEEDTMPELTEAEVRELREAADRAESVVAENTTLRAQLAEANARSTAGPIVDALITASDLPAATYASVREAALRTVPVTDAGALDEAAFTTAATAAIDAKRAEVAAIAESLGAGRPRGLGDTSISTGGDKVDPSEQLTEALTRLGATPEAAKHAARGRI
jgi:hypothetical protein